AALTVAVDAGPLMSFGDVEVHGLKLYPRSVVVGLRPFRRGERYRLDRVIEYQNRLRESGYFSTAAVYPDVFALDADRETRLVPIDVTVTEAQPRRVTLGLGYGTDQGYRAQIGYEDRNFLGRAWQLETSLTWDQVAPRTIVNLRSPYDEDGRFWAAGFRLERFDLHNTRSDRTSATLGRGRRIGDAEHLTSLSYQFEQLRVTPAPGVAIDTTNRAVVLGYSWTLRRVDSRFDPTQGYTLTAQVAGAAEALGSDQSFLRLYTRGMRFIPVATEGRFAGGRLILSLEVGAVLARDSAGIPQENLFRAGGSRSIRGYDYLSLGAPVGQAILAGRYLLVGSVEYQHPITELVSAAVFYDRGNATDSLSGFRTFAGYGVGARVRTPLGPIALDLAYGEQIRSWRWHLSVGFVF
ncbi:MAG TPA: BamA/TamA family outer membrane protein, partial [Burkholderiaceae bacterium]|nr:BamA/TamA family outer membrane protein [Burkholderiaceae bacterium]